MNDKLIQACKVGSLARVNRLLDEKYPMHKLAMYWAARLGRVAVVKSLIAAKCPTHWGARAVACGNCHTEIVQLLTDYEEKLK